MVVKFLPTVMKDHIGTCARTYVHNKSIYLPFVLMAGTQGLLVFHKHSGDLTTSQTLNKSNSSGIVNSFYFEWKLHASVNQVGVLVSCLLLLFPALERTGFFRVNLIISQEYPFHLMLFTFTQQLE